MIAPAKKPSCEKTLEQGCRDRRANAKVGPKSTQSLGERVTRLRQLKIEYISCSLFDQPDAAEVILGPRPVSSQNRRTAAPRGVSAYFARLYETPLLDGDEESYYFRKMNYLLHCASRWLSQLPKNRPSARRIDEIEAALAAAAEIKNRLVEANLRLVVSIAKQFMDGSTDLTELVSDGNLSLIRAVDKFDYSRGFKFSTYATYAIRRNFFRTVISNRKARRFFVTGDGAFAGDLAEVKEPHELTESQYLRLKDAVGQMLLQLGERERLILTLRFGFGDDETPETLSEIARRLGVCKERIRQIQTRAMEKLNGMVRSGMTELAEFA